MTILFSKYGVSIVPSFVFVDESGNVMERIQGEEGSISSIIKIVRNFENKANYKTNKILENPKEGPVQNTLDNKSPTNNLDGTKSDVPVEINDVVSPSSKVSSDTSTPIIPNSTLGAKEMNCVDGNWAIAHASYRMNDVAYIYPITPASP